MFSHMVAFLPNWFLSSLVLLNWGDCAHGTFGNVWTFDSHNWGVLPPPFPTPIACTCAYQLFYSSPQERGSKSNPNVSDTFANNYLSSFTRFFSWKWDDRSVYSLCHWDIQFSECVQHWLLHLPFLSLPGSLPAELCCCCLSVHGNILCSSRHRHVC